MSVNSTTREALRYAKDLAGIPRSQQPVRQWIVTDDVLKYANSNYVVSVNTGAHAGMPKPNSDPYTYDLKNNKLKLRTLKCAYAP